MPYPHGCGPRGSGRDRGRHVLAAHPIGSPREIDTAHQHQLTGLLDGLGDDPAVESME